MIENGCRSGGPQMIEDFYAAHLVLFGGASRTPGYVRLLPELFRVDP